MPNKNLKQTKHLRTNSPFEEVGRCKINSKQKSVNFKAPLKRTRFILLPISMSPRLPITHSPYLLVSLSPCLLAPCLLSSLSPLLPITHSPYLLAPSHPLSKTQNSRFHHKKTPKSQSKRCKTHQIMSCTNQNPVVILKETIK